MMSAAAFRKLALSLPDATEAPHFELASFRVKGKIFSTLSEKAARAMVKLAPEQQEMMVAAEPKVFERIPNAWGDKGATWMHLRNADKAAALSALTAAWENVTVKAARQTRKGTRRG
jgi:hypothetical protein